jgi:class 3 adenylate cyclase
MNVPPTRYAKSGDFNVAYQVIGDGPVDLVFVMGWASHMDLMWQEPRFARFLLGLAAFSRLILFDKRGTGLSDRVANHLLPTLEQRIDDVRAVLDACGSARAVLLGVSEGGPMCALFAATYPERTRALVMINGYARRLWAEDYPCGSPAADVDRIVAAIHTGWGTEPVGLDSRLPSLASDPSVRAWWTSYLRSSASPGAVLALTLMNCAIDTRAVLPLIQAPTLIVQSARDRVTTEGNGRYLAANIPGAKLLMLDTDDHLPWFRDASAVLGAVAQFVTGTPLAAVSDRVLATVLFTDIVDSTPLATRLGDRAWRDLLDLHARIARAEVDKYRGRWVKSTGDGMLATFDGPARAIGCAAAIRAHLSALEVSIRAGLHTGECEMVDGDVVGIAVHIAARIAGQAGPGEIVVSGTVKDLVAGSGIEFADRGDHALKGVDGRWRLFGVRQP